MPDLMAARAQMAISLGFHIVFAAVGMAMPLLMVLAEFRYRRTGDRVYLELARRWAKGTAILFAVGAVSGTVLSFELGLLWPKFMEEAGPIIGMPFSLEGFAFFLEAIFLGVYLYGWDRVSPRAHLLSGVAVALSGLASGVFVVSVNAWMNTPVGFSLEAGQPVHVDYVRAFFSPAFFTEALHTALASYVAVAFLVLSIHAFLLLRDPQSTFHRAAATLALAVAAVATPLQIESGDLAAKHLASVQPRKLAAAEALFHTERGAPLTVGGIPDPDTGEVHGGVRIPYALSILATGHADGIVHGLEEFPRDEWPPVVVVHGAFEVMVASGSALLAVVLWAALFWVRKRNPLKERAFLPAAVLAGPLGIVAIEAGWAVTEVGRQPWVIVGVMKTADALTIVPHLAVPLVVVVLLYGFLGALVVLLLRAHVLGPTDDVESPSSRRPSGTGDAA